MDVKLTKLDGNVIEGKYTQLDNLKDGKSYPLSIGDGLFDSIERRATEQEINLIRQPKNKNMTTKLNPTANFGIKVENDNSRKILDWFSENGFDINKYRGGGFDDRVYYVQNDGKVHYSQTIPTQIQVYTLDELTSKSKIKGYNFRDSKYRQPAKDILGKNFTCFGYDVHITMEDYIEKFRDLGVLDLWFVPVFESPKETVNMGSFKLLIKDNKVIHKGEDITQFVKDANKFAQSIPQKLGSYDFNISFENVIISKTGCETGNTTLSQWVELYNKIS